MKNYYEILQVSKSASQEVIGKVYKHLAKKYHPDANLDNKAESEEKFKEISEAYEVLSDETSRKSYDIKLENAENSSSFNETKFYELQNYCSNLESEIAMLKSQISEMSYRNQHQKYQHDNSNQTQQQSYQQNAQAARNAYNDAYTNMVKNLEYKKNFKQRLKDLLAFLITITLLYIFIKIIFNTPSLKEYLFPIL